MALWVGCGLGAAGVSACGDQSAQAAISKRDREVIARVVMKRSDALVAVRGDRFCRLHSGEAQDLWAKGVPSGRGTRAQRCAQGLRALYTPDRSVAEEVRSFREYGRYLRKVQKASRKPGAVVVTGAGARASARIKGVPESYKLERTDGRWLLTEGPVTASLS